MSQVAELVPVDKIEAGDLFHCCGEWLEVVTIGYQTNKDGNVMIRTEGRELGDEARVFIASPGAKRRVIRE